MKRHTFSILPILAVALAALTAGCSNIEALMPTGGSNPGATSSRSVQAAEAHSGAGSDSDKVRVLPLSTGDLDCPPVDIADGGATFRVGGADNTTVRYQFDISDVARQCVPQGSQFALKIGISGLGLVGPAGAPGTLSTDLKIVVANSGDKKPVYQKTYKIAVNTNGGLRAPFELVADPVLLPLTRTDLDTLYTVTVGFGNSVGAVSTVRKSRRHS